MQLFFIFYLAIECGVLFYVFRNDMLDIAHKRKMNRAFQLMHLTGNLCDQMDSLLRSSTPHVYYLQNIIGNFFEGRNVNFVINEQQPVKERLRKIITSILMFYIPFDLGSTEYPDVNIFCKSLREINPCIKVTQFDFFCLFFYMGKDFIKKKIFTTKYDRSIYFVDPRRNHSAKEKIYKMI